MAKKYPSDVIEQAQDTLVGWQQITPPLPTIGTITPTLMTNELAEVTPLLSQMAALEAQLTDLRNQRDALYGGLWDKVKRVRSGVKGIYGDDSSAYEMVGGTRLSERKRPSSRTTDS